MPILEALVRRSKLRMATVALCCLVASVASAQNPLASVAADRPLVIVDGARLPRLTGILDSIKLGHYTVDSSVTPHRARVSAVGVVPGGLIFFPMADNIDNIEIIKGASAALQYGEEAAAGVIIIRTKKPSGPGGTM